MKKLKNIFVLFLAICICFSTPFVLTSCKKKPVDPLPPIDNTQEEEEDKTYGIVLKNFVMNSCDHESDEKYAIDFGELHFGQDENGDLTGYGSGKVYGKTSSVEYGEVKAVIENDYVYVVGSIKDEKINARLRFEDVYNQIRDSLELPEALIMSYDEFIDAVVAVDEHIDVLMKYLEETIEGGQNFTSNSKTFLLKQLFDKSQDEDKNTIYTFSYDKLKLTNDLVETLPLESLYEIFFGFGNYDKMIVKISNSLNGTIEDFYNELYKMGHDVNQIIPNLDKISSVVGALLSYTNDRLPNKDAIAGTLLETILESGSTVQNFDDVLRLFNIEVDFDVKPWLLTDEVKQKPIVDALNYFYHQLNDPEGEVVNHPVEFFQGLFTTNMDNLGKKTAYQIVADICEMMGNEIVPSDPSKTAASVVREQISKYIETLRDTVDCSFVVNEQEEILNATFDVDFDELSFNLVAERGYKTSIDYSNVKGDVESKLAETQLTSESLPASSTDYVLQTSESGNEKTYTYTRSSEDGSNNEKYAFVFDQNNALISISHIENDLVNTIKIGENKYSTIVNNKYCGNKFVDVAFVGNDDADNSHIITLHYDLTSKKFVFECDAKHNYVEVEADRKTLEHGDVCHYVCQNCGSEYYDYEEQF